MTALAADIARFTSDGRLITKESQAVRDLHDSAQSAGELEMFFDNPAHADIVLAQRFALLSMVPRVYEGIQVGDGFDLGTDIPVVPAAPNVMIVDSERGIETRGAIRAYSFDHTNDSFAIEVVGTLP